ncbi:hypothetical protein [Microseira sp. BLCC-F43]|uniref:hypothetical protein n=1 Tax=Microseira sp. BLCC-F43 TaxID=3153602 RepID=UPI0035B85B79
MGLIRSTRQAAIAPTPSDCRTYPTPPDVVPTTKGLGFPVVEAIVKPDKSFLG